MCEGRNLALSELTAFALLLLSSFTITSIPSAYPPGEARPLHFRGEEKEGVAPKLLPGRGECYWFEEHNDVDRERG